MKHSSITHYVPLTQMEPLEEKKKSVYIRISVCKSGPVRSFGPKMQDRDRDRFTFVLEPKKTGPD